MKFFKWKIYIITSIVCLLPILLGTALWNRLPDTMAIHFDIYGKADNFASKEFVVFGLPALMAALQWFSCFINDINTHKHGERKKFTAVTKWIIPVLCIILQTMTLAYGLGYNMDIRRIVSVVVGTILVVIGNYLPKFDFIKNYDVDTEKAIKINRFIGYETVAMGILFFISALLPPICTVICLFLLIPYAVVGVAYGIINGRK